MVRVLLESRLRRLLCLLQRCMCCILNLINNSIPGVPHQFIFFAGSRYCESDGGPNRERDQAYSKRVFVHCMRQPFFNTMELHPSAFRQIINGLQCLMR